MNIKELTLGQIDQLQSLINPCTNIPQNEGFCVVVLDRGFIYIGELIISKDYAIIKNARNLRRWSSNKGLMWHVENGKEDTTIDGTGKDVKLHVSKLQHWMNTDFDLWK